MAGMNGLHLCTGRNLQVFNEGIDASFVEPINQAGTFSCGSSELCGSGGVVIHTVIIAPSRHTSKP